MRSAIPGPSLAVIDSALPTSWIPIEHDQHVPIAIIAVLGLPRADRFWRWFLCDHLRSPLLRTLTDASIRLFGLSPSSLMRLTPRGWNLVYRDFCSPQMLDYGTEHATLQLRDMAKQVIESSAYLASFRAVFGGFLDMCKVEGSVAFDVDRPEQTVRVRLYWH